MRTFETHNQDRHAAARRAFATIGSACALFVLFSIGAAIRHKITGEVPGSMHPGALALWGWPVALPLAALITWIARPLK